MTIIEQMAGLPTVIDRLVAAIKQRDLQAFVDCFAPDYRSERPLHPADIVQGREQVRSYWARTFTDIPDLTTTLLRSSVSDDEAWTEWQWQGLWANGTRFNMRGVIIFGLDSNRISWSRVYMEPVHEADSALVE